MASGGSSLTMWVIYRHPADFPQSWVLRGHSIFRDGIRPCDIVCIGATLEAVRAGLPAGLTNLGRYDNDDPVIHEVWV